MSLLQYYITPIILDHIAKYVKNIDPEDYQFLFWQGAVALQNLDLKLDVIEAELKLPLEFLTGHIHELSISIPWNKITSEPIKIIINVVEIVVRLKDTDNTNNNRANSSPTNTEPTSQVSTAENGKLKQNSSLQGLVFTIISNIVIECHNIMVKLVEEDIMLSVHIKSLSLSSADESWKAAFNYTSPPKVFMRKLAKLSYLSICLDKKNAAGQIDVYQEPILYRLSLEIRVVCQFNFNTLHLGYLIRVNILTKLISINLSTMQFPIAKRLCNRVQSLNKTDTISSATSLAHEDENNDQEVAVPTTNSSFVTPGNVDESVGTTTTEERDEETLGKFLDIGVYVEGFHFTLQSSELITDSTDGTTKKIHNMPILKLIMGGMYSDVLINSDRQWLNLMAGFTSIHVQTLEGCKDEDVYLLVPPPPTTRAFLESSLFDQTSVERKWNFSTIESYTAHITDEYLRHRSPALALDLVKFMEESSTESQESKFRIVYRIFASSWTLRHNQKYAGIAAIMKDLNLAGEAWFIIPLSKIKDLNSTSSN